MCVCVCACARVCRYRYTRNSTEMLLTDCQYAALLLTTRSGAMRAVTEYMKTSQGFGLSLSIPKTKVMVAGREARSKDCSPVHILNIVALNMCEISHILDPQLKLKLQENQTWMSIVELRKHPRHWELYLKLCLRIKN